VAGVVELWNCVGKRVRERLVEERGVELGVDYDIFTEIATPPTSIKSRNSNSSVQIQIIPKSQFEFALRDTEEFEFLDLVDFRVVAFSVETVIVGWSADNLVAQIESEWRYGGGGGLVGGG